MGSLGYLAGAVILATLLTMTGCKTDAQPDIPDVDEARRFQENVLQVLERGQSASDQVQEVMQEISEGRSGDVIKLNTRARWAHEAWGDVESELARTRGGGPSEELREAVLDLAVAARNRKDAFKAIMVWLDSKETSELVKYRDRIQRSDRLIIAGMAKMVQYLNEIGALDDMRTAKPSPRAE